MELPGLGLIDARLENRRTVCVDNVALYLLALFLGIVAVDAFWLELPLTRPGVAFGLFTVVPGALFLTLMGFEARGELRWLLYSVGVSLLSIMSVGLTLSLVLPPLGVQKPLSALPLGAGNISVVVLLALAIRTLDPETRRVTPLNDKKIRGTLERWFDPRTFALLLLPLLTVLSVVWLNRTGDNSPLLGILILVSLIPLLAVRDWFPEQWYPMAIWTGSLTLLWHKTLWGFYNFSGQSNIVNAWKLGRWSITERGGVAQSATTPLLPNVTISPTFAHLGNLHILTQIEIINPVLVSIIPIGSFVVFRRVFDPKSAILGAAVIAFIHPFYLQLPAGGRAAMPVLFVVLTAVAMTDSKLDPLLRKGLAIGFAAAVVTAHYGASYFVMAALLAALVTMLLIKHIEPLVQSQVIIRTDGGETSDLAESVADGLPSARVLSVVFVILYVVMAYSWHLYTFGGKKFSQFFIRVSMSLYTFLTEGLTSGGTANRIARNYGTASIQLSKIIYITLAALTAVGFLTVYVRRLSGSESKNPDFFDEYVAFATGLLAVFSLTFFFKAIWGGGRPMALTFSLTAVFAVVGIRSIGIIFQKIYNMASEVFGFGLSFFSREGSFTHSLFAMILAILLILNTGVAAAAVFDGFAPSNVVLQERISSTDEPSIKRQAFKKTDTTTYVWLKNNGRSDVVVFGDPLTRSMASDWYGPQIAAGVDPDRSVSLRWRTDLSMLGEQDRSKFVVLSSHNVELGSIVLPEGPNYSLQQEGDSIFRLQSQLGGKNRVYTTGASTIYTGDTDN